MLTLEKYHGLGSRHTCPSCGRFKKFTRYIDLKTGEYIADHVGRCDRESSCGYHYKPKEYFSDNTGRPAIGSPFRNLRKPKSRGMLSIGSKRESGLEHKYEARFQTERADYIESEMLLRSLSNYERNDFVQFLLGHFPFDPGDVWQAVSDYLIGTHETGRTIFWQIDPKRRVRTGKVFSFKRETGNRDKKYFPFLLHSKEGFELQQCFFGEHLLAKCPDLPIAITEAEKTAVIGSICKGVFPDMVWLACGGRSNINAERLARLGRDRKFVLYPDADGFEKWQAIASDASKRGLAVNVSDLIEKRATDAEKAKDKGINLWDYLVREQVRRNDPATREAFRDLIEERLAVMTIDGSMNEDQAEAEIIASGFFHNAVRSVLGS